MGWVRVQGRGWGGWEGVGGGWAGTRERAGGVGCDKGGVVVGGKGWVGKAGAATRHHKVRGGWRG